MADGGLLALIACLGLAQLSHETTPALAQLAFTALSFFAMAALPIRPRLAAMSLFAGLAGLALSGAATMALLFGAGGLAISLFDREGPTDGARTAPWVPTGILLLALAVTAALAAWLDLWRWRISPGRPGGRLALAGTPDAVVHLAGLAVGPVDPVALAPPARQPPCRPAAVVRAGVGR